MQNGWILDVLADLRAFARLNGMDALDQQLQQTFDVATASLAEAQGAGADGEGGREEYPPG